MKSIIILAAFAVASVAASTKTLYGAGPVFHSAPIAVAAGPALASTGSSSQFRSQDSYGNSNFGYDESHATGATSRREEIVNGVVRGSYSLSEADGRRRLVNYVADDAGFRANIQTNEPGVEPKDPADVLINKAAPVIAAPAPVAIQPAPVAWAPAPLPAPILRAPVKGYAAAPIAPIAAPIAAAPIAAEPVIIDAPRAFSYSIGVNHLAAGPTIAYGPAPLPIPQAAPVPIVQAPIVQQQNLDY